jgi:hypothetical protein
MKETVIMKVSRNKWKTLLIALAALPVAGCQLQIVITKGLLTNWFWSRLGWAAFVSAILGVVAAKFLCRLPIKAPLLDCINTARTRFLWWALLLVLVVTPLFLWLDAWISQPFRQDTELGLWTIMSIVILDLRTLAIMFVVAGAFYLMVAIFTRYVFSRTCSCKYAFFPKFGN